MLLAQLADAHGYDQVFVAPHLDDVALSCGGLVGCAVTAGQRVLVVTICAGSPPADAPLTPFAAYLHAAWQLGPDPMALRRAEDVVALGHLAADGVHLEQLDAIYRDPAYGERDGVFGPLRPGDPLVAAVAAALTTLHHHNPQASFYLPLAVGNHVDHQAVWQASAALAGTAVAFYEDFPYAAQPAAVAARRAELPEPLMPDVVPIEAYLERKVMAIAAYQSQQLELFPDQPMAVAVRAYAAAVGDRGQPSERLWRPQC